MEQKLKALERTIGAQFKDKNLLRTVLAHPSFQLGVQTNNFTENFQRLEFLGDSVLNFFIARELYHRFPKADEGLLSRLRSILVSRKLLARIARSIRLSTHVLTRKREQQNLPKEKILADAFEVLLAAIYFDRGKKAVEKFLLKYFEPYFDQRKLFQLDPNPKSTLQEYTQKKHRILPTYRTVHDQEHGLFTTWVSIKSKQKTKGHGRTKQDAESQAAAALLKKLKIKRKISSGKESVPAN